MINFDDVQLVDSHCHVDLFKNTNGILDELDRGKIATIAVTNAPSVFHFTQALPERSKWLLPALGLHPELVASHGKEIGLFKELVNETKFVGEIGLDYVTRDEGNRELQRKVFREIVECCAASGPKVLTIHSRRSAKDVVELIGPDFPGTAILHWFSGSMKELETAIDYGFWFSVNGRMFHSESGQRIVRELPNDRVVTESDSPFVAHDGSLAEALECTIENLSFAWDLSSARTRSTLASNFKSMLDN